MEVIYSVEGNAAEIRAVFVEFSLYHQQVEIDFFCSTNVAEFVEGKLKERGIPYIRDTVPTC